MDKYTNIEHMDRTIGFCPHEYMKISILWWEKSMPILICAVCDLMLCAIPEWIELTYEENLDVIRN